VTTDYRSRLQASLGAAYTLERELGGGGMSTVYLAEETAFGRKVVVKVLPPDLLAGASVERFKREIQLAARLQQAQIVPVLAAGEVDGIPYYTMPFVDGESLRAKLSRVGPLPIHEIVGILRDVTRALAYAHDRGVVHRDIKPDNVLLSGGTAVVTDFGIAKAISDARASSSTSTALTQLGTSIGTPAYISPEQAAGDPNVDHRADLYSLGCMAYELLTGQTPFSGRTPQRTLAAHLTEAPAPVEALRADVPPALAALVMRCLEKEPSARPQTAAEIASALEAAASGVTPAMQPGAFTGPGGWRRALVAYAIVFAGVALIATIAVVSFGLPDWVFTGAIVTAAMGLPVILATAYAYHTAHRVATQTPAFTAGGSSPQPGGLAGLALRASPHLTFRRSFRAGAIALGAFAVVVAAIMIMRMFGVGPAASLMAAGALNDRERLLVIDFDAGADSSLSHVVTEAVRTNLGQSRVVSIMPPTAVASALQRMERSPSTRIDLPLAREIALREGAKAIVSGSIAPLGAGYALSVRLISADSGSSLASFQKTVDGPGELLDGIDELTRKLRGRIGESLKTVRNAPALDQVTTGSLEALRKYADAQRAADLDGDYARAAKLLREAVATDTTFAMAYRKLGVTLNNLGMPRAQIDSALTRAYDYRNRLSEKERYLTVATYYMSGPGRNRPKAAEAYEQALAIDPLDVTAANNLANILRTQREFSRAESLYASIARSPRASQITLGNLAGTLFNAGKVAQSESVYLEVRKRFPNAQSAQTFPAVFLYQRGRLDSLEAFWKKRRADPNPVARIGAISSLSTQAMLRGRMRDARSLRAEALALNEARGVPTPPLAEPLTNIGVEIWFFGRNEQGIRSLDSAVARTQLRSIPIEQRPDLQIASYYAWAGRPERARTLLAEYDADVKDTTLRANLVPAIHGLMAEIAIAEKRPHDAVREYWKADSMPDGPSSDCTMCMLAPVGRAYDLANMPDSAIAVWERYLATPYAGRIGQDASYLAGIRKRLGEMYEAKGDTQRAATNYLAFIELWKNADPELQPQVAEVRKRLAKMKDIAGK
jgi:tetratricopeptide (TPR) repeat protein/tRNA A-37 threonylcarbamoyl transferase component Bud32